nr:er membrane protein complex subunit 7 like [Quercus suber]
MLVSYALALLVSASLGTAAKLTVSIPSTQLLPNPNTLPPSTHAILTGPPGVRYDNLIRRDNTFTFSALEQGSYLLTVHTRDFLFSPLRVDVSPSSDGSEQDLVQAWQTFRGNEWSNKGPSYGSENEELSIEVKPMAQKSFYQQRGGFNLLGFLKSPMILMGLVSVVFIFGLPYLMENMDPETKAEFEEMQKNSPLTGSGGAANQLQNFDLAGWMAVHDAASSPFPLRFCQVISPNRGRKQRNLSPHLTGRDATSPDQEIKGTTRAVLHSCSTCCFLPSSAGMADGISRDLSIDRSLPCPLSYTPKWLYVLSSPQRYQCTPFYSSAEFGVSIFYLRFTLTTTGYCPPPFPDSLEHQEAFQLLSGAESVRHYEDMGDSGNTVKRSFCGTCGSSIFARPTAEDLKGLVIIMTGTLEEGPGKAALMPSKEFYCKRRRGWMQGLGGVEAQSSCLCGAVKYSFTGAPLMNVVCHCTSCQKLSGSAFQANSMIPETAFQLLSGAESVRHYEDMGDSGNTVKRSFCGTCGSSIFARPTAEDLKGLVIIMTGTLEEGPGKAALMPSKEFYCKRRRGWMQGLGGVEAQSMT